jgi:Mrp family chromosome partitioning ATPase
MGEDAKSNGLTITKTPSVDEMSVAQMLESASALTVIIARKNLSSLAAVRHAKEVLARSNNNVVGVVLVTLNR